MSCGSVCCVCGEEHHEEEHMHDVKIKGETKKVCNECLTAIKGLI